MYLTSTGEMILAEISINDEDCLIPETPQEEPDSNLSLSEIKLETQFQIQKILKEIHSQISELKSFKQRIQSIHKNLQTADSYGSVFAINEELNEEFCKSLQKRIYLNR
jgi:hypothetical protein